MSEYPYRDDYERESTKKYEDVYTPEEIDLSKQLYEVGSDKEVWKIIFGPTQSGPSNN